MIKKGFRFRLTIWYTAAFSLAGALIFSAFYLLTRQALFYQTDSTLADHGNKVVEVAFRQGDGMHDALAKQAFLDEFSKIPGMLVVVANDEGKLISSSTTVDANTAAVTSLLERSRKSEKPFLKTEVLGNSLMRFWIYPLYSEEKFFGSILLAHPVEVIMKSLDSLLSAMVMVYLGLVLFIWLAGYLLARSAIKPISDISEKLKRVSSENLRERVEVPKTGDEIEELATTFNGLLDRLNQAFMRERQFIGDVAHELKTPLATLSGGIEVALRKNRTKDEYRKVMSEALMDTNRISTTLRNILDLAWTATEASGVLTESIDLSKLASDLKEIAVKLAGRKNIKVSGKISKEVIVCGKADRLSRAFLNIVDNAIKFTPNGGRVEIELRRYRNNIIFSVKDNGMGIGKKDLPHIFERFYRGEKSERILGSGLGLAIAQAIVLAHKGRVEIKSRRGRGTLVEIYLPQSVKS